MTHGIQIHGNHFEQTQCGGDGSHLHDVFS